MKIGRAQLLGRFKDGSPEWHEARSSFIGGSDIPIILGLSQFKSAFQLWHEKAGLLEREPVTEDHQRKYDYGHHMEPFIADQFRKKHAELQVHDDPGTWVSLDHPWMGCNPDRLIGLFDRPVEDSHAVLQMKTANWESDYDDGPPPGYIAQLRHEMDVFGFSTGFLGVYFNVSGSYREWTLQSDPFLSDAQRQRGRIFADSITEGTPPEIDGSEQTYRTIRRLNPSLERGKEVVIPDDVAEQYLASIQTLNAATADNLKWKGHLLAHMGTAQWAIFNGKRIASRVAKADNPPYLKEQ